MTVLKKHADGEGVFAFTLLIDDIFTIAMECIAGTRDLDEVKAILG
jgi:hypothetical protein